MEVRGPREEFGRLGEHRLDRGRRVRTGRRALRGSGVRLLCEVPLAIDLTLLSVLNFRTFLLSYSRTFHLALSYLRPCTGRVNTPRILGVFVT